MKQLTIGLNILVLGGLVLCAAMPWGISDRFVVAQQLMPVAFIFRIRCTDEKSLPAWAVFLCGLMLDAATGGPLGYWSLLYLVAAGLAPRFGSWSPVAGWLAEWLASALAIALVAVVACVISSLYTLSSPDAVAIIVAAFATIASYPLISLFTGVSRASRQALQQPQFS